MDDFPSIDFRQTLARARVPSRLPLGALPRAPSAENLIAFLESVDPLLRGKSIQLESDSAAS